MPAARRVDLAVHLDVDEGLVAAVLRGRGERFEVPLGVALARGETILGKQVVPLHAEIPPNTNRVRLTGDEVEVRVPNTGTEGAAAYRILIGFELTPQELATNRRRRAATR